MGHLSNRFLRFGIILLLLSVISYFWLDRDAVSYFYEHYKDSKWAGYGHVLADWTSSKILVFVGLALGAMVFLNVLKGKGNSVKPAGIIFTSYAIAIVCTFILKFVLARYRPDLFIEQGLFGFHWFSIKHAYTSIPSGHAATVAGFIFPFAVFVFSKSKLVATLLVVFGVTVIASRVFITAHYLSDALVGTAIGSLSFSYVLSVSRKGERIA